MSIPKNLRTLKTNFEEADGLGNSFYFRALEIIQDEQYLEESDFDEIKRQKRQINPWTPALIGNNASLIKDVNSSSKLKINLLYDHSTFIKSFIEATDNVISAFKEPVHIHQKTLKRQKRQNQFIVASLLIFACSLDVDGTTFTDIDSFISSQQVTLGTEPEQFCLIFTETTTISDEKATFLTECPSVPSASFPIDASCQLLADVG